MRTALVLALLTGVAVVAIAWGWPPKDFEGAVIFKHYEAPYNWTYMMPMYVSVSTGKSSTLVLTGFIPIPQHEPEHWVVRVGSGKKRTWWGKGGTRNFDLNEREWRVLDLGQHACFNCSRQYRKRTP